MYVKDLEPFANHDALMSCLFGMLSAAHNRLSQFEAEEERRDRDRMHEMFTNHATAAESRMKKAQGAAKKPAKKARKVDKG